MNAILNVVLLALRIYQFILLARVLLSWFPDIDRSNPLVRLLYDLTEPVLEPIRRALPRTGMFDLSPLIVFFGITILMQIIVAVF
jgi:YggT family protein